MNILKQNPDYAVIMRLYLRAVKTWLGQPVTPAAKYLHHRVCAQFTLDLQQTVLNENKFYVLIYIYVYKILLYRQLTERLLNVWTDMIFRIYVAFYISILDQSNADVHADGVADNKQYYLETLRFYIKCTFQALYE